MPYVSTTHKAYYGTAAGDGHCVALVRECCGLPRTSNWRRGVPVRGSNCAPGTAIATFNDAGEYPNTMSGDSHAAILLSENRNGLLVADQWLKHLTSERVIRFRNGSGNAINDGDRFYVIELADE